MRQLPDLPDLFAKQWRNCGIRLGTVGIDRGHVARTASAKRRDCYVVVALLSGAAEIDHCLSGTVTLTRGDMCLLPPGYGYNEVLRPARTSGVDVFARLMADLTVIAPGTVADPLLALSLPRIVSVPIQELQLHAEALVAQFDNWFALSESAALYARFDMDRLLALYFHYGFSADVLRWSTDAAPEWLIALRYWMGDHVKDPRVTVEDLAQVCGYSASHVQHAFKSFFGCSPLQFLRRLRMDLAAKLLSGNPSMTVADVAERCGYRDASLFARHFRSVTGQAPREFRRGH